MLIIEKGIHGQSALEIERMVGPESRLQQEVSSGIAKIEQKKGSTRTSFLFEDSKVRYTARDSGGKRSFSAEYASIQFEDFGELEERSAFLRNLGIIWCLLGFYVTGHRIFSGDPLVISMWVPVGFVCLLIYWFRRTTYTVLEAGAGNLLVIQGKGHDEILNEIETRRRAQWKQRYDRFDPENDAAAEIEKFRWLFDRGVLNEREFDERVSQVEQAANTHGKDTATDRTLN